MPPLTIPNSLSSSRPTSARARVQRGQPIRMPALAAIECLLDVIVVACLSMIFCALPLLAHSGSGVRILNEDVILTSVLITSIVMMMLVKSKLYRNSEGLLHIRETACVIEACLSSGALLLLWAVLTRQHVSLAHLTISIAAMVMALIVEKHLLYKLLQGVAPERLNLQRTVVVGQGAAANNLFATLLRSPKSGLYPVALYDPSAPERVEDCSDPNGADYSQQLHMPTAALLAAHHIDLVLIDKRSTGDNLTKMFVDQCRDCAIEVAFAGDSSHESVDSLNALDLDGQSIYAPHANHHATIHAALARALDIFVSFTMLLVISMPALLIALIIKMESEGPILYRQRRVGHNGKLFTILKFRTMFAASCGDALTPSSSRDPRITRSGRWLRKTSLDELPQLWNVLSGDMALVGPRPEMPFIVAGYSERQRRRLSVRPGLTGIWQLSPHRAMPIHENMQYDLYYLRQRSFTVDVAILLHTVVRAMNGI